MLVPLNSGLKGILPTSIAYIFIPYPELTLEKENKALNEEIKQLTSIANYQQETIRINSEDMKNLEELRENLDKKNNQLETLRQQKAQLESQFNAYTDDAEKKFQDLLQEPDKARTEAQGLESKMANLSALHRRATHNSRSVSPSQRLHTFNTSQASSRRDSTASTLASTNPPDIRPVNQRQTPQEKQHPNIRHVDRSPSPIVTTRKSTP